MSVQDKKVVEFHYSLKLQDGQQVESSFDGEPMAYLHGANNIISGLESAMTGRAAGDRFEVTLAPEQAYGPRNEGNIQRLPLKRLGQTTRPRPGQVLTLQTKNGMVQVTVLKVGRFNVDVDANHPLAGQSLTFDIEIVSVRDASPEELSHGHVHGPGGHDHGGHDHDGHDHD